MNIQTINLSYGNNLIAGKFRPGTLIQVFCDATSGAFTVTLPNSGLLNSNIYEIIKTDSSNNAIAIECSNNQKISGLSSVKLFTQYNYAKIRKNVLGGYALLSKVNGKYEYIAYDYPSLLEIIAAIGSNNADITINGDIALSENLNIPTNIDISKIKNGAMFTGSGTLTINRMSADPQHQIFGSGLTVVLNNNVVKPEWWGAVGDGVTDDTAAIQAAINSASSSEKTLLFSRSYLCSGNLTVANKSVLRGINKTTSLIAFTSGGFVLDDVQQCVIASLGISAPQSYTDSTSKLIHITSSGGFGYSRRIILDDLELTGHRYQVYLENCFVVTISNCWIHNPASKQYYGLYIKDTSVQTVSIQNTLFQDAQIYSAGGFNIGFSNQCYFESGALNSPCVELQSGQGGSITGCSFEADAAGVIGLKINSSCIGMSIINNAFHRNGTGNSAVVIDGQQIDIRGNQFIGSGTGSAHLQLGINARKVLVGPNYNSVNGDIAVEDLGQKNRIYKKIWSESVKFAQELYCIGAAYLTDGSEVGGVSGEIYVAFPDTTEGIAEAHFPIPEDMCDNVDKVFRGRIRFYYYSSGTVAGKTLRWYYGYKKIGIGDGATKTIPETQGNLITEPSGILAVDEYTINIWPDFWTAGGAAASLSYCRPTVDNGYWYQANAGGGTRGGSEPTWPTTVGGTVVDNTVTWTCVLKEDDFIKIRCIRHPDTEVDDTQNNTMKLLGIGFAIEKMDYTAITRG